MEVNIRASDWAFDSPSSPVFDGCRFLSTQYDDQNCNKVKFERSCLAVTQPTNDKVAMVIVFK